MRSTSDRTFLPLSLSTQELMLVCCLFFFSSRRRHTRFDCDWSSDVCSSDLALRIVGSGPERSALERLAADVGVACVIDSRLSEDAMVRAYRGAEVVVCPSRFEGFGLTPMEAIACGRPVGASDIPPHRGFLGTAPRFFAVGDDDGVAAALAAARSDPAPAPAAVRALRIEAAVERFSAGFAPYLR